MSTWWDFECLDHEPPLRSEDEFSQHTDDAAFKRALELAASRPVPAEWWDDERYGYFERNALRFLQAHPKCRLGIISEYGERRGLEP